MHDLAIIGGGFSGAMLAVQVGRQLPGHRIFLLDRNPAGPGLAYGTRDAEHLLNVRAKNMSAFADDHEHFYRWLMAHPDRTTALGLHAVGPDSFVPRLLYGEYLKAILHDAQQNSPLLEIRQEEAIDIAPLAEGYEILMKGGGKIASRQIVFALGNFPPAWDHRDFALNPYAPETQARLAEAGDVFIVGSGLTTLDLLATLVRIKPQGVIHLLSRSGLLPQVHEEPAAPYPAYLDAADLPRTALALLSCVRREIRKARAKGIGWQSVIDALRPLNQKIWQGLALPEQKKFLRHIRPYWDTHRHRAAPEIMAAYEKLRSAGRLIRHRGTLLAIRTEAGRGADVTWLPRGQKKAQTQHVQCAVMCTGPEADYGKLADPLVKNLLARQLLAVDALRLGLATAADGGLLGPDGQRRRGLYTIGPSRKGTLYESTAVPELRQQAADLAGIVGRA